MVSLAHLDSPPASIRELPSQRFIWILFVLLIAWAVVAKSLRGPQTELVELDERDLRMQRSADRAGDWTLTLVVIAVALLLAYVPASASGVVAVAADRRECADWPADRKGVRRSIACLVACYALGTSMTGYAVRNDIRQWRLARAEMTQAELARLCGVTRQTIIALEAGKYSPSLELAFKLARALGRNLDEVFQLRRKKIATRNPHHGRLA